MLLSFLDNEADNIRHAFAVRQFVVGNENVVFLKLLMEFDIVRSRKVEILQKGRGGHAFSHAGHMLLDDVNNLFCQFHNKSFK